MTMQTLESFSDYSDRIDRENELRMRDPPTQDIDACHGYITYPDGTIVQWVCPCGGQLNTFYEVSAYRTFVKCQACGKQEDVHTG